jgi:hypothetical protein
MGLPGTPATPLGQHPRLERDDRSVFPAPETFELKRSFPVTRRHRHWERRSDFLTCKNILKIAAIAF